MLGDLDLKRIRHGLIGLEPGLTLTFHASNTDSAFSSSLSEVAYQIAEVSDNVVQVERGEGKDFPDLPVLSLSHRGRENIHYMALPEGPEALPFVEAMLGMLRTVTGSVQERVQKLSTITKPAEIYVFIANTCPHCSQAVRAALQVSVACRQVTTYVIDAQQYKELSEKYSVRSVPFTVLDGELSTIGAVSAEQLVEWINSRDDQEYQNKVFQSLVEVGRIADVSAMILSGDGLDHFLSAWLKSSTSSRLGLMMVAENCLTETPDSLVSLVPGLLPALKSADAALRGDTADLLGQIGDPRAKGEIETLLQDPNPDVVEIAEEALESLSTR